MNQDRIFQATVLFFLTFFCFTLKDIKILLKTNQMHLHAIYAQMPKTKGPSEMKEIMESISGANKQSKKS